MHHCLTPGPQAEEWFEHGEQQSALWNLTNERYNIIQVNIPELRACSQEHKAQMETRFPCSTEAIQ